MEKTTCDKVLDTNERCGQIAVARVQPGAYDRGDVGAWNACARHVDDVERARHQNSRGTTLEYFPGERRHTAECNDANDESAREICICPGGPDA